MKSFKILKSVGSFLGPTLIKMKPNKVKWMANFVKKKKKKEKKRNLLSKNSSHLKLEMFDSG